MTHRQCRLQWLCALLFVSVVCGSVPASAQQQVTGVITDAQTGRPLPGASVVVSGTTTGTAAGADGSYELPVPPSADSLRFSFVGYETETVALAGRSVIDVALSPSTAQLQELVVVGYGEQEVEDLTGVIQTVGEAEFNTGRVVSPLELIAGKVAGVQITSTGGPGGGTFIRIRGGTSINASNKPLFVVDGVPLDDGGGLSSGRNPLNFLNPGDIESVTVLKDASATAIYGARGANGVIIIETKTGQRETQVTYSGSVSFSQATNEPDVLGVEQFRKVISEHAPELMNKLGNARTDWRNAVLESAVGQEHSLSFSGGREDLGYRFSLGYLHQGGVVRRSATERVTALLNYHHRLLDDRLNVSVHLKGARMKNRYVPESVVSNATIFAPTQPIEDADSEFGGYFEWENALAPNNPVAELELTDDIGTSYRSIGNIEVDYRLPFFEGLSANINVGYDVTTGERKRFSPSFLRWQVENDLGGEVSRESFTQLSTLLDAYLSYENGFERYDSEVDVTAGYSYQQFHNEFPSFYARGLSTNLLGFSSTAPADESFTSVFEERSRLVSFFGRLNYSFKDKYLLTLTVRQDGSSRFGPENRWGTFPSVALAWQLSEEAFMQGLEFISNLKLRASWGITGNQEIGMGLWRKDYVFGGPRAQVQFGDEFVTTVRPDGADPSLKWEETTSYNLGVDYGLFGSRVTGSFEYYYKRTDDLLFPTTLPAGSNLTNIITTNVGSVRNRGFEFNVNALVVDDAGSFSWDAGLSISTNDNELLRLNDFNLPGFQGLPRGGIAGGVGNTIQILQEGAPVRSFFLYRHKRGPNGDPLTDGVDHNGDGVVNLADMYVDVNGDGTVNAQDRTPFESPFPDWIFGHTSRMTYKNIDFSFTLRAHLGNYVYNNVASDLGHYSLLMGGTPANLHASVLETGFQQPQYFSDMYVEDASFLRMHNITLGYTIRGLPSLEQLRLYATVENAFTLTGYSGVDPEIAFGIDNEIYPRSRTYTLGATFRF